MVKYNKTVYACFVGIAVQSIVNNFLPLLFITLQNQFNLTLSNITFLITLTFAVQLFTDFISIFILKKISVKVAVVVSHLFCCIGLFSLSILPFYFSKPLNGFIVSVILYSSGAGMLEVLLSPIVEHCPSDNKEKMMSVLHSFYCIGHVCVILCSTLFFFFIGIEYWRILCIIWACIPLLNIPLFLVVSIPNINEEIHLSNVLVLFKNKSFWFLLFAMVCAGASEIGMSQWASTFVENTFGVSKMIGDLIGPLTFAVMMAFSRIFYGRYGHLIHLNLFMLISAFMCVVCYILIGIVNHSLISFISFALCGFCVGIMWPGVFSLASNKITGYGTTLFAILALAGDIGCTAGPAFIGYVSSYYSDNLRVGILLSVIFPVMLFILLSYMYSTRSKII